MSEMLSQEEIDALLKGSSPNNDEGILTDDEMDALSEICNVSMNVVATSFLSKLKQNTTISVKSLSVVDDAESSNLLSLPLCSVAIELTESVKARTFYLFNINDIVSINDLLIGGDGLDKRADDLDDVQKDIFVALMKEVMPDSFASIAEMVKSKISTKAPEIFSVGLKNDNLKNILVSMEMVKVTYAFEVGNVVNGEIIQLIPVPMVKNLVELLLDTLMGAQEEPQAKRSNGMQTGGGNNVKNLNKKQPVAIQSVTFPNFDDNDFSSPHDENIDFILDVPLQVSVELGRTHKMIKEILAFNVGSIVELNNLAEDYVDILVNGKLVARGEVIVVDENFGVRIMEVYTSARNNLLK